jgi:hypothetical protein
VRPGSACSHAKEHTKKHVTVHESSGGSDHRENRQAQQLNEVLHGRGASLVN